MKKYQIKRHKARNLMKLQNFLFSRLEISTFPLPIVFLNYLGKGPFISTLVLWFGFSSLLQLAIVLNSVVNYIIFFSGTWRSACLHVSRMPFYKSPQTRLIYPRGRFYKELRKWFSERGCLLVSPTSIFGIKSRCGFDSIS